MFQRSRFPHTLFSISGDAFIAEASELGLPPGQWPDVIHLQLEDGRERKFHPWRAERTREGDVGAMVYRSEDFLFNKRELHHGTGHVLKIFND